MNDLGLFDRQADVGAKLDPASMQFGGITIFAATPAALESGIERLGQAIRKVTDQASGLNYSLIQYFVAQQLGQDIPTRCFGAVLGRTLHFGQLDIVVCEASTGRPFRIYFSPAQMALFTLRVDELKQQLVKDRRLLINVARAKYFPANEKGDWTRAMYIVARLVRLGLATYEDKYRVSMPASVGNAFLPSR